LKVSPHSFRFFFAFALFCPEDLPTSKQVPAPLPFQDFFDYWWRIAVLEWQVFSFNFPIGNPTAKVSPFFLVPLLFFE